MTPREPCAEDDLLRESRLAMPLSDGAVLLGGFARPEAPDLLTEVHRIAAVAPFRRMVTPDGRPMSVAITNCGSVGWVTDRSGYRYTTADPQTDEPWPVMPRMFREVVWGGPARLSFHGIDTLDGGNSPAGAARYNLTFRKAGT